MSLFSQVVVAAFEAESTPIVLWDLQTTTQLASFKGNSSGVNALTTLGNDYLVASQTSKDALHFWTWHKEAVLLRSFVAERVTALSSSPSGAFVAGGGASGNLYVWCTSTGRLLLSYKAHFKGIRCVKFTDSGSMLITAADDAIVNVWSFVQLLDATAEQQHSHTPRWSWSRHTLPVTSLSVGAGEADPIIVSASLDHTCRVWSVATGECVQTILLPAALHCVALHWTEQFLFAGSVDGHIHAAALRPAGGNNAGGNANVDVAASSEYVTMQGHSQTVTCLALSTDGLQLVSGSLDGSVRVWDTATRQMLHALQQPCKTPVTGLLVLVRPPYLHVTGTRSNKTDSSGQAVAKPARPMPLAHFAKLPASSSTVQAWEDGVIVLDGTHAYGDVIRGSGLLAFCERGAGFGAGSGPTATPDDVDTAGATRMGSELAELKRKYAELTKNVDTQQPA